LTKLAHRKEKACGTSERFHTSRDKKMRASPS
jgi:hypothetical protein